MAVDTDKIEQLEALLARDPDFDHLRVKKRGDSLTIVSGQPPHAHARFTALGRDAWGLSFRCHTARWEPTPFVGTMEDVFNTLATYFPFYLNDVS